MQSRQQEMQHRSQHRSPKSSRRGHFYKVSGPSPLGSQGRLRDAGRNDAFPPHEHPAGAQQLEYPPRVKYKSVFLKPEVQEPPYNSCGRTAARVALVFVCLSSILLSLWDFEFTHFESFRILFFEEAPCFLPEGWGESPILDPCGRTAA